MKENNKIINPKDIELSQNLKNENPKYNPISITESQNPKIKEYRIEDDDSEDEEIDINLNEELAEVADQLRGKADDELKKIYYLNKKTYQYFV